MAKKRWSDLSPRTRKLIVTGAVIDGGLRIAALLDLRRRPPTQINGRKPVWAIALAFVNSAGLLPLGWFLFGRRR